MIASHTIPTTTGGYGRFLWHGRLRWRPPEMRRLADQGLDIFTIARRRAAEFGRVTFVLSHWDNPHWNVVFADGHQVSENDVVEYVAYPPRWIYQPAPGRLVWLRQWQAKS